MNSFVRFKNVKKPRLDQSDDNQAVNVKPNFTEGNSNMVISKSVSNIDSNQRNNTFLISTLMLLKERIFQDR